MSLVALVVVAGVLVGVQLLRSVPPVSAVVVRRASPAFAGGPWSPALPAGTESVVTIGGVGTLASQGGSSEIPIASVAKVMSALVVLRDHPLRPGQPGPAITVTPADVATYRSELAAQDSVVAVQVGERLSELDALKAALVPSADNVIEMLARWDAGSTAAFVAKMNAEARQLGLAHTHYAGPSGVDPATVSTAADQVRLARIALGNPVFASIVARAQVVLPVAGLQYNVDADLGRDGIVGVKTGWVPQGGASFVFAANHRLGRRTVRVLGAIVGDSSVPAIPTVLSAARRAVRSVDAGLVEQQVVGAGTRVATLDAAYGAAVPVVTASGATLLGWRGARVAETVELLHDLHAPVARGARVGTLTVSLGSERASVALVAAGRLAGPTLGWRLTRL